MKNLWFGWMIVGFHGWFMFGMKFGERYGGLKVEVMEVSEGEVEG